MNITERKVSFFGKLLEITIRKETSMKTFFIFAALGIISTYIAYMLYGLLVLYVANAVFGANVAYTMKNIILIAITLVVIKS